MRPSLVSALSLLPLVSIASAQSAADAFTYEVTPPFRGASNSQYAGWDVFTVPFAGVNLPDDPASDLTSSIEQFTPGAIITSTMNIYHPSGVPSFALDGVAAAPVQEIVLQVVSFGNPLDDSTFVVEYDNAGATASVSATSTQVLNPTPGFAEEKYFRFDLSGLSAEVTDFRVAFSASDVNCSLGAVMVDLRSEGEIGTGYCSTVANSTGVPASLVAWGSDVASANNFELRAAGLPASTFGLYLVSSDQAQVMNPGGSEGTLCLGGEIGRFVPQIFNSGASGSNATEIDLGNLPTPTGSVAAVAGDTWNFQAWFRDANPTTTSNFTSPVSVTFQ